MVLNYAVHYRVFLVRFVSVIDRESVVQPAGVGWLAHVLFLTLQASPSRFIRCRRMTVGNLLEGIIGISKEWID